jgi:DNA-binding XRE family transcriptional regulator
MTTPPHDEFEAFLRRALRDPEMRAAYDDASARHAVLDGLVAARHDAGLTQSDVAKRMDVGQPTISELESEGGDPRLSTIQRYARAVGCRIAVRVDADDLRRHRA